MTDKINKIENEDETPKSVELVEMGNTNNTNTIISESISGMTKLGKFGFDLERSKELKEIAIKHLKQDLRADFERMEHAYTLQLAHVKTANYAVFQKKMNAILDEILITTANDTNKMLTGLEKSIQQGLKNNKEVVDEYREMLSDGIISQEKFEKNVTRFMGTSEEEEEKLKVDLKDMLDSQRERLRLSLKNFVDTQIQKTKIIDVN